MIFDNALAHSIMLDAGFKRKLKVLKPWIRRYVFNADASHKQGRFVGDCTDIICRNSKDALPPYPNTYIEIDNIAAIDGAHQRPIEDAAEKLGFLWTENGECLIVSGNEHKAEFNPFIYVDHDKTAHMRTAEKFVQMNGRDETHEAYQLFKTELMVGFVPEPQRDEVRKLTPEMTNLYEVGLTNEYLPLEVLDYCYTEGIGSLKRALACLLLLDERIKRQLVHVKARQRVVAGKLKTVPKHSVVTIDLDVPEVRKVYDAPIGTHATPIEHEISEHWVHIDCASQCQHDWMPYYSEEAAERDAKYGHPAPLRREICKDCGGRRTRKPVCVAGDPRKGSNIGTKRYKVIASKEKEIRKGSKDGKRTD